MLEDYNGSINRGAAGVRLSCEGYDFSLDPGQKHDVEAIWDATCRAASAELTDGAQTEGLDYYREHGFRVRDFSRRHWYLYPEIRKQNLRFELPYQEQMLRIGKQLKARLHEKDIHWWDKQLTEYEALPSWQDLPGLWEAALEKAYDVSIADYPFWLVTTRSMQYAWGGNVGIQMIREVADNMAGHGGVIMNPATARQLGRADGDRIEIKSPVNATRGRVVLRQGIRPDTVLMVGQFDHWATPLAKDFDVPSMNALTPMLMDLTDATGSSADLVKVAITKLEAAP